MRKALSKSVLVMAAASGILTTAGGYAFADASADGAAVGSPGVGSGNAVQVPVHVPVNVCGNTVNVIGLLNPAFGNKCGNGSGSGNGGQGQGASAEGAATQSPGVLSGNLAQVPVDVPVNACGNSVDVVGVLNPAVGNECTNESGPGTEPPVVTPPVTPPVVTPPVTPPVVTPPVTPPVVTPPVTPPVVTPPVTPPVVTPPVTPPVVTPPVTPPVVTPPVVTPPVTPVTDEARPGNDPTATSGGGVTTAQLAHTGADTNLGLAGGASAAMVLGGALLLRRTRARATRN
ncbi:chaplin [Streptomyces sp. NPDC094048]|uniref:chaplin n=1 Tax=Streptomyces sp. NPDC094048 TaxID=3155207 RepID=UPI00332E36D0